MATPKLARLRSLLQERDLAAYVIPHDDAHLSEYTSQADSRIKYISGFAGSAGLAVVTLQKALLWTDSRYYIQAVRQLEKSWELMKYEPEVPMYFEYLAKNLKEGEAIGVDPTLFPHSSFKTRKAYFEEKKLKVTLVKENLVDIVWNELTEGGKKPRTANKVILHSTKYTGETVAQKVKRVRSTMKKLGTSSKVNTVVLSELDDIAWLLNLRGTDIEFNPLFFSYALVYLQKDAGEEEKKDAEGGSFKIDLYIDKPDERFTDEEVKSHLTENKVTIKPYEGIFTDLEAGLGEEVVIGYDGNKMNHALASLIQEKYGERAIGITDPVAHTKCVKIEKEVEGMRKAEIRDGAALAKYFSWLNQEINVKGRKDISEYDGAQKLAAFRAQGDLFMGLSFDAISSIGDNGAVIHYKPEKETAKIINNTEIYLLDSGAHYLDGTTDTTRTTHLGGTPTEFEKQMYTRVLRGNLDLQMSTFDRSFRITGGHLDVLARKPLWEDGRNYGHGTGHGVGFFLNVHEGPQSISLRSTKVLEPGMIVSDEPGYYEEGKFGIRIEDLIVLRENKERKNFVYWENLTKYPYARELIDTKQLTPGQIDYINKYHETVLKEVGALLEDEPEVLSYLKERCAPLE